MKDLISEQNEQIEQVVMLCSSDKCALAVQNIPYILKNIEPKSIFIITAQKNFDFFNKIKAITPNLHLVNEDTMFKGLNFSSIKSLADEVYGAGQKRTGWYFQQFLKMAWAFNEKCEKNYLVWDCDTFPLQKIRLNWNGKRIFNIKSEFNLAYFDTLQTILGINKQIAGSFISEFMYFEKEIMQEIILQIEKNAKDCRIKCDNDTVSCNNDSTVCDNKNFAPPATTGTEKAQNAKDFQFFEIILNAVKQNGSPKAGFSEFETYGSYLYANYPQKITFTSIPTMRNAANYCGMKPKKWQLWYIGKNHVTASFETWSKPHKLRVFAFNLFSYFLWLIKK